MQTQTINRRRKNRTIKKWVAKHNRSKSTVVFKNQILAGEEAMRTLNKKITGHETAIVNYFDDNGNRRRKFIPHAVFAEMGETGCVNLVQIASDGHTHIPLHKNGIKYCDFRSCIEVLLSYTYPSTNQQ